MPDQTPDQASPLAPPPWLSNYATQIEGVQKADTEAFEHEQKELSPKYDRLSKTLGAGVPKPPEQEKVEPPPRPEDYHKHSMEFASAMAVLGAVSSAFTRHAGNASLNAFAGALNGWQQGNVQAYEEAAKRWEQATKQTIENNRQILEKYKLVLEDRKLNIDAQMAQIQLIASQYHDKITADAAAAKNYTLVAQIYEKNQTYTDKVAAAAQKLQENKNKQDEKNHTNAQWLASPTGQAWIAQQPEAEQMKYRAFVQQYGGHVPRSAPAMALQKFLQEHPEASAEQVTQFAAHYGSVNKAERDFATGKQGQQINSLNVGISHIETLRQLGEALNNGNVTRFNQIAQRWAAETGNPAPTNFDTAKQIVGTEIIKALVAGGGGVGERDEMQHNFNRANSPAALAGVADTAELLLAGQFVGLKKQYEQTTGQSNFDDRLTPEALRIFQKLSSRSPIGEPVAANIPQRPAGVPEGSAYSPSRNMWKSPKGQLFGPDGTPARE